MKTLNLFLALTLGVSACFPCVSFGAGFQIPEQGARSIAMGMSGIGLAEDLSAMYHNPAGLTQGNGTRFSLNVAGIEPTATYTRAGFDAEDNERDLIPVPFFAVASDFGGRLKNVALGFDVNAPFGLRNEYDSNGPQRYLATNISLVTAYAGPYAAWQIAPRFSIGAGVQYVYAKAEIGQKINYGGALYALTLALNPAAANRALNENLAYDGNLDIKDATDGAWAGNLGALWTPTDALKFGLTWRSGVDLDLEGDAELTIPATVTQASGGLMQSLTTTGKTTVSLPQIIGAGVSYKPTPQITLTGDVNWINWSVYKNLDFDFETNTAYLPDKDNLRDWEDTWAFRLGGEYLLKERIALRAGVLFDQTPIPTKSLGPELPTGDRAGVTLGAGYAWDRVTLDAAYAHLFIEERTVSDTIRDPEPFGKYESAANIFGASVTVAF